MCVEFGDVLLDVFLFYALDREDSLSILLPEALTVVDRNDVRRFETICDEFINDSFPVGQ